MKKSTPHAFLTYQGSCSGSEECLLQKTAHTNHQTLSVVEWVDPLQRPLCGLARPPRWRLIAVLISLFLPNLFARSSDPTAMLNERVYQLKPVVRSTRGLIFSLRNERNPSDTSVQAIRDARASKREITGTQSRGWLLFLSCTLFTRCSNTWWSLMFSLRRLEKDLIKHSHRALICGRVSGCNMKYNLSNRFWTVLACFTSLNFLQFFVNLPL